jgi:hypothetical protein
MNYACGMRKPALPVIEEVNAVVGCMIKAPVPQERSSS